MYLRIIERRYGSEFLSAEWLGCTIQCKRARNITGNIGIDLFDILKGSGVRSLAWMCNAAAPMMARFAVFTLAKSRWKRKVSPSVTILLLHV